MLSLVDTYLVPLVPLVLRASVKALATAARIVTGWAPPLDSDGDRCSSVVVFEHTSRWDFLVMCLMAPALDATVYTLVKPQLFEGLVGFLLGPFLTAVGCLPAPRLEDRGSGSVSRLVSTMKSLEEHRGPVWLCLSPKGTTQVAPWRSGYKQIAAALNWPVRAARICFQDRSLKISQAFAADHVGLEQLLQAYLARGVAYRPDRAPAGAQPVDPFELLAPIDWTVASLLAFVPSMFQYGTGLVSSALLTLHALALSVAFVYHGARETILHSADALCAKSLVSLVSVRAILNDASAVLQLWQLAGLTGLLYLSGTPRHALGPARYGLASEFAGWTARGAYVVWHSLFHICGGALAYQLVRIAQ